MLEALEREAPARRSRYNALRASLQIRKATGDIDAMSLLAGQSVGLVAEIKPAGEVVREIIRGAQELISRKLVPLCADG